MNVPVLIFWAVIAWSFTASNSTVLVLLLASTPFVSLALLPPGAIGMSLLPQSMFAVVLILKVLSPHVMPLSSKLWSALQLRNLGYLALFLVVGAVATVLMPRLFGGEVVIVPMRDIWGAEILSPVAANFTQVGYVTLSVLTAIAVMLMVDEPSFSRTLLTSVLAGGIVTVATGLIDIGAVATGLEGMLKPFRNADYAYITTAEIAGVRRVVGFTPEASTYGNVCVQFLAAIALLRTLYEGRQRVLATTCAASLGVLALFSTSSTAYLGLAILVAVYTVNWLRRAILSSSLGQSGLVLELLVGLGVAATLLVLWINNANLFNPLINLVEEQIFNKPLSSSFYERSFWNTTAWNAVLSTWGLGVGFGSTRTSNWFAAVVSNAGLLGAVFMALFLVQTFLKRPIWRTPLSSELLPALKMSLIPALFMACVVTAGPDFGIWVGVVFGAITGIAGLRPRHSSVLIGLDDRSLPMDATGINRSGRRAFGRTIVLGRRRNNGSNRPAPRPSF